MMTSTSSSCCAHSSHNSDNLIKSSLDASVHSPSGYVAHNFDAVLRLQAHLSRNDCSSNDLYEQHTNREATVSDCISNYLLIYVCVSLLHLIRCTAFEKSDAVRTKKREEQDSIKYIEEETYNH